MLAVVAFKIGQIRTNAARTDVKGSKSLQNHRINFALRACVFVCCINDEAINGIWTCCFSRSPLEHNTMTDHASNQRHIRTGVALVVQATTAVAAAKRKIMMMVKKIYSIKSV